MDIIQFAYTEIKEKQSDKKKSGCFRRVSFCRPGCLLKNKETQLKRICLLFLSLKNCLLFFVS